MNKIMYRIVIMSVAVILLITGTYIGMKISDDATEESTPPPVVSTVEEPTTTPVISKTEDKDIEVTYEDYYTDCKHTISTDNTEFGTTIEKIKEKADKDYEVISETETSIVFRREVDSNCPNHFELKLVDDYVVIYQLKSKTESTIYKRTEHSRSLIRDELVAELEKGIKVESLEELNSYLEDLES